MKKLCVYALLIALIFSALPAFGEEMEEPEELVSGNLYYKLLEDGTAEITYWAGGAVSLDIPAALDGHAVTALGEGALSYWDELERVELPDGLVRIGPGAFEGCVRLKEIALPDSVREVGDNPFKGCESLFEIGLGDQHPSLSFHDGLLIDTVGARLVSALPKMAAGACEVPEGVSAIGAGAFEDCARLISVTLPEGLEAIGESAFAGCAELTGIALPESVMSLGESAFARCERLGSAKLSPGLEAIAPMAFEDCTALEEISIPEGVTEIGEFAFSGCTELQAAELPGSLVRIGDQAFDRCAALERIALPDALAYIGEGPFSDCVSLGEFRVSEDHDYLTVEDGVLFSDGGDRLVCYRQTFDAQSYAIPEGTVRIGDYAFYQCGRLISVAVPDSVTEIGGAAFDGHENLTLSVGRGSYAEAFARENGLKYTYPGADAWLSD